MHAPEPAPRAPFSVALAVAAPLLAVLLYVGMLGRPLDIPDLDFISDSPRAAAELPADVVWGAPFPPERPDLGIYRPVLAQALKLEYKSSPGSVRALRSANLALLAILVSAFHLLAWRALRTNLARAVAVGAFALHPVVSESVNLVVGQGALIAASASVAAMVFYLLAIEMHARAWIVAPAIAALYFLALGAHEAAALLPISILILELFRPAPETPEAAIRRDDGEAATKALRKKKRRGEKPGAPAQAATPAALPDRPAGPRLAVVMFPMAVAAAILAGLRWVALDGALGARAASQAFAGEGAPGAIVGGAKAALAAAGRLAFPWPQTLFYPARYESLLGVSCAAGLALLAAIIAAPRIVRAPGGRTVALGALLAAAPLVGLLQIVPLSAALSDRMLLMALPGFALALGAALESVLRLSSPGPADSPIQKLAIGACGLLVAFFGLQTLARNLQWNDGEKFWAAERKLHPTAPQPVAGALIDMINRHSRAGKPFTPEALAEIDAMTSQTQTLAKPPDADPALQFVALAHAFRGDRPAAKAAVERGLAAPGPHAHGFFQSLGSVALQAGELDLAATAFGMELERRPTDFVSNFKMIDVEMGKKRWERAADFAKKARIEAPSHLRAQTFLREGLAAANLKTKEGREQAGLALTKAIELEPTLGEAYITLARLYLELGRHPQAEQVILQGRSKAAYESYVDLFSVGAESLERQKQPAKVVDFLSEMTRIYSWDIPLAQYAGGQMLKHGQHAKARELFKRVLNSGRLPPQEALFGMARISEEVDRDNRAAASWAASALQADPSHAGALALYQRAAGKPYDPAEFQRTP